MTSTYNRLFHSSISLRKLLTVTGCSVICALATPAIAQDTDTTISHTNAWVELAAYGSTASRTPFWLHANQWGIVPTTGQVGSLRAGVVGRQPFSQNTESKQNWTYVYGLEAVGNASKNSKFLLPQAYAGIAFKSFQLTVGRRKEYVGFNDNELGTGSYMWSGNALPIPKVQIGFENYVPLIRNFVYFKGFYSDGFLENTRPVTSHLKFHNKALFVRLGKPDGKVKLHGGFNHAVQWGGRSPYFTENGKMPGGIDNYWYVVTGFKPKKKKDLSNFDRTNRIGNHVASLDAGLELDLANVNIFLYRQNLVEDGSLFYLNNIKDGLNGVIFKMKNRGEANFTVDRLTLELLYTKSQGGSETTDGNGIRGKDDYFNNGQVRDGWSYYGRGIGTPFITATAENNWPKYADFFTNNNRVWVTHAGLKGKLNAATWVTKFSLSSNQGTYDQGFPGKIYQFSALLALEVPVQLLGGSVIKGAVSMDQGELFENAFGGSLSIRKNVNF
ncbi:capsule assembly Wzi family protein [Dyadobacter aurulentus]|uniref:capsule assembly Wzi family protein n=1 Tax=Dyadobacter sp. UC 10 TaxID=2605428 RepID=UPI0011F0BA62|nr:capsule assembly Wzi family protein [Dyadobacter sp. UC 10]KAA0988881.1 capsule assembly Wzi family protein [Dyadobacter sp. UC 10]